MAAIDCQHQTTVLPAASAEVKSKPWSAESVSTEVRSCLGKCHAGGSRVTLSRFRMALIGLLAVACTLEMWAANVVLNLAGEQKHCFA